MLCNQRTIVIVMILISLLSGCSQDTTGEKSGPKAGPGGVKMGMTRSEVIQVMLDEVQLLQMSGRVTNPYSTRFFKNFDGESLEVMYYYTGMKKGDDLVTEDELLPVILKENAVVGWGWETLVVMTGSKSSP